MSTSLLVAALGAVVAAVGTGVLAARCARTPGLGLVAWTVAAFALAVALGAQTLGYLAGYSALIFRAMELGAQVLAPLALCLGLGEVVGRSMPGRFAMRLAVSALAIILLVIAGTDPLNPSAAFSKVFPDPLTHYEPIPRYLLELLAIFTAVIAVTAVLLAVLRSGRDRGASPLRAVLAASAAALATAVPGLSWLVARYAGVALPLPGRAIFAVTGLGAAALIWFASAGVDWAALAEQRGAGVYGASADSWPDHEAAGLDLYHAGEFSRGGGQPAEPDADVRYPALAELAAEAIGDDDPYLEPEPEGPLFGQIAIYTLLEDRLDEFDRLTERVIAKVRAQEPNTLAFIAHAVPTAPMQRIMYEVYRDRSAYEEHLRMPYVTRYEEERRPYVLATNVIELGLKQAKVSPFPTFSAISDILSESGIDLTGVTRSPRVGGAPPEDQWGRPEPRALPGPAYDRLPDYSDNGGPDYEHPYQGGWAEIRGDDTRNR